jgi:hypothetical protein
MTHYRSEYRAAARAALVDLSSLAEFKSMSAWSQNIDADTLPVFGVATPTESKERESHSSSMRSTNLVVVLKTLGGDDIEDELDVLSDSVEVAIITALGTASVDCDLQNTTTSVDGQGGSRIGTLSLQFTVITSLEDPVAQ